MSKQKTCDCQPCTACCDGWLQIVVEGQPVYPGKPCHHSTGSGCNDYANRPEDPFHWLRQFAQTHQRALLYSEQIVENSKFSNRQAAHVYGPPEFQQEMAAHVQNGLPLLPVTLRHSHIGLPHA